MLGRRQGPHSPQTHGPASHTPMPFTQSTLVTLSAPSVTKDSNTLYRTWGRQRDKHDIGSARPGSGPRP